MTFLRLAVNHWRSSTALLAALSGTALSGTVLSCSPDTGEQMKTGSQTNWLKECSTTTECGQLECVCGACTRPCDAELQCAGLDGATCVMQSDPGAVALCGGQTPPSSLCLPLCGTTTCDTQESCIAGVCVPDRESDAEVTVDLSSEHQTLLGFGASLAYMDDEIAAHSQKESLFDVMFSDSGFEVLRMRNRFEGDNPDDLQAASEILAAATARLGRTPAVVMTAGSPPAALKANASRMCAGDPLTCTLIQSSPGAFDYQGLADHWRASLEANAAAGIVPDYLSIQNNPNWVPDESTSAEACRYLPEEGVTSVMVDGTSMDVTYPGYQQALDAVRAALVDLPNAPKLAGPEVTSLELVAPYTAALAASSYDVIAYHLYVDDPSTIEPQAFDELRAVAQQTGHTVLQTEMRADGLDTAVLAHHSVTAADAAMYLQNDFTSSANADSPDPLALIALTNDGFEIQAPYHALRHYASHTDAGWIRVDALSGSAEVLSSAWVSPEGTALTVILVNPAASARKVALNLPVEVQSELTQTEVIRTVFDGVERSTSLGSLPSDQVVSLPSRSIVTVALRQ